MTGGRRAPRRQGAVARLNQKLNALKVQTTGTKFTPAPNPPDFVEIPWNSYTFQATDDADAFEEVQLRVADLISKIRAQMNISQDGATGIGNIIKLKILDVAAWCTASVQTEGIPDLEMRVYELNPSDILTARTTIRDIGTLNMPAKAGYKFPVTDSKQVFSDGDAAIKVASFTPVGARSRVTRRAHILWKSTYTSDP